LGVGFHRKTAADGFDREPVKSFALDAFFFLCYITNLIMTDGSELIRMSEQFRAVRLREALI
jgi:hypothetical protein